jgi:hypothetical protein
MLISNPVVSMQRVSDNSVDSPFGVWAVIGLFLVVPNI